jgi:DNA polymerase-3 subunit delta'
MAATERLPWHADVWKRLQGRLRSKTLPHALLITGQPGLGKRRLAFDLATAMLCTAPDDGGVSCGDCRACRLVAQGAHPDFFAVEPEEGKQNILIDQIRALGERLSLSSQYGSYRIGLIDPADRMNSAAANALLKTLEEPPANVVLLLTASRPSRLPATIRSRCQQVALAPPPEPVARAWLREHGTQGAQAALGLALGAPLRAIELDENGALERWQEMLATLEEMRAGQIGAVTAASRWQRLGRDAIPMLQVICADLARLRAGGETRLGDDGRLRKLASGLDLSGLHRYTEQLLQQRRHLEHPLNEQLVLESAFAGWLTLVGR